MNMIMKKILGTSSDMTIARPAGHFCSNKAQRFPQFQTVRCISEGRMANNVEIDSVCFDHSNGFVLWDQVRKRYVCSLLGFVC